MNKLLCLFASSLLLFSCSKSDSPTPPPPPPPVDTVASFMTAGWTKVMVTQSFLSDIAWIDADHLVTNSSQDRQIFGTANGGQSWQAFPFYAYGDNLIKIPDGSLTWTNAVDKTWIGRFKNGIVDSFHLSTQAMDLFYLDATHGFASLATGSGLAETHSGGDSWQIASTGITLTASSQYSTLFFLDSLHGITGFGLQVYNTTTGIHSWQASVINDVPTGNYQCSRLEMISPNVAYAGFTNGALFRSTDTGKTFSSVPIPTRNNSGHWLDTQFFDADHGYACHDDVILQTLNGGTTWDTAVFDKGKMFIELEFLDQNHGAVVTKEGAVYLYKH